ncbi:Osmolarity sensor protein EnvZ [Pandoraea pneumonica]|uniref:histidine kinase n=1 Tax=Pandoraea pneumonica TaxID=2508299 RepID=A0A5E4RZ59_9BURK|nr:ATP-binding protein [Pandoraea pneumonica]VVD68567.1 Osmolarity sensor protein EnvZ [Pandoraea pneumonica]
MRVPDVPFDTTKRDRASRTRRYFGWLGWPRTLSGRLALILVVGMLATQLVTGTVWFDARYGRVAEVPVRTGGARIADAVKLFDVVPVTERAALMARLRAAGIDVQPIGVPAPARTMEHFSDDLFDGVLRAQLGDEHPFVARPVVLYDDASEPLTLSTLLRANAPTAHLAADVQLRDGQWLSLAVVAGQAGLDLRPGAAFADYFVRIYLMRILAVVLIAVVAVRIALRPLARLSDAADRLGRDIHSPPLDETGPAEVQRAAHTFNAMQRSLIDAMQARTAFLAAVSHDLRSPLTRLRLRAETLAEPTQRERFRHDLMEMEAMIAASLDHVRGVPSGEALREIDVDALLRAVAEDARETGSDVRVREQSVAADVALVRGYPRTLRRCVQNLVDNAVRYAGGCRLSANLSPLGTHLEVVVEDRGPGIPEAELSAAVEPFVRAGGGRRGASSGVEAASFGPDSPESAEGVDGVDGVGLGLAIARTIAQAHDGTLMLSNRPGGGLRAVLSLPVDGPVTH